MARVVVRVDISVCNVGLVGYVRPAMIVAVGESVMVGSQIGLETVSHLRFLYAASAVKISQ